MNKKEFRAALAIAFIVADFIKNLTTDGLITAIIILLVMTAIMFLLYWFNNSHSQKAKFGDYVKESIATMIECGDLTKVDKITNILEGDDGDDD